MKVTICDACGVVLEDETGNFCRDNFVGYELCPNCREKFEKIRDKYNGKYEELEKQRIKIEEEKEQELKEIGINNELPL